MKKTYTGIKNAKLIHKARDEIVPKVMENLKRWSDTVDDVTAAKPWITEQEKKDLLEKIAEMQKWMGDKIKEQAALKLSDPAVLLGKDVEAKFKPVQRLYKKTMGKKAPPKVEEPKEEKKEEKSDEKKEDKKDEKSDDS